MKHILRFWLLLVITFSCVLGIVYLVVQQDMRMSANDPQIQMAEDTASSLDNGKQITLSQNNIDIAKSLSPFIMTFDVSGKVQSSEATLGGVTPVVPEGVFMNGAANGQDRFTWQPETGVRIAAVVTKYNNGFVLAGRNIREVEKREDNLFKQILFGWLATVIITFFASLILIRKK